MDKSAATSSMAHEKAPYFLNATIQDNDQAMSGTGAPSTVQPGQAPGVLNSTHRKHDRAMDRTDAKLITPSEQLSNLLNGSVANNGRAGNEVEGPSRSPAEQPPSQLNEAVPKDSTAASGADNKHTSNTATQASIHIDEPSRRDSFESTSTTTYLITGANRGLGLGFCRTLVLRPDTTVIAAVRDLSSTTALKALPVDPSSRLILVKIDSHAPTDAAYAIHELESYHQITSLDVVIANAGIEKFFGPVASLPPQELRDHFEVNAMAPLALFQACWPLLQKSARTPKFVPISSRLGSNAEISKVKNPAAAYGASKAMLNYLTSRMHFENEGLIAFPISPGFVQTDMGNAGARKAGMKQAVFTIEQSVGGMMKTIDNATREKHGGTFQSWDGTTFGW